MKIQRFGSRAAVYHENALMTTGRLRKKDLMKNKHGRIVSAKKHRIEEINERIHEYIN
jgi:hypothetical protein